MGRVGAIRTHTFGELHRNEKVQQWSVEEAGYQVEYIEMSWAEPIQSVSALQHGPQRSSAQLTTEVDDVIREHLQADMEAWWAQTPVHVPQDADLDAIEVQLRALGYLE